MANLGALNSGTCLWGSEDLVQKRAAESEETLNGILKFFQARVQAEEKYAKALGAITSKVKLEGGTLGQGWQTVRDQQNAHLSQSYIQNTTNTNQNMILPIDAARKKYGNDRSRLANDIASLKKEMQRRTGTLTDKKNAYWRACDYHHKEKKKFDELSSSGNQSKAAKMQPIVQKATAELEQATKEYREYVADYNDFKSKYEEAMRAFLNEYEAMDNTRLSLISDLLRGYIDQNESACVEEGAFFAACRDQMAVVSASKDIQEYLASVSEPVPPKVDQYEEYETAASKHKKDQRAKERAEAGGGEDEEGLAGDDMPAQIGFCALPKFDMPDTELLVFARALFDFPGEEQNELRFRRGDVLIVRQEHASGWWVGELFGREGLFPACYVEIMKDRANLPKRWPPPGLMSCTARSTFVTEEENLLSFDDGEVLVITDECDGWYVGENNNGVVGMFPSVHVSVNERSK
uniref:SH3 domain-containing protein n=1 Tax=Paramoeba aestuarina TaxID=180227 RepID=A0A7S4PJA5_9EUKA|mmetsp:Transcript_71/g.146  ORF Transcript_71/g.146 Transcript_71/m.146 type:complete len:464 (+) Transcript_71:55-1446(+)|eukprot:CAMPEP_0201520708 /NCGR_PEP_ID=MMETSP0161_2-20130828/12209_1 /ASSEMBLY_ACC=CAM_ASM_000251 /TAXON_ID=180227 /ORGANISM="Neoparamoeba aestuarina, Strain SoJaBio B1-5/56/2" /LENGTH=463 /DNA_ID=CAMNT_0047919177 /DNA_START=55 /DNA_END=1446 /DNA_ORIENTATION=+